MNGSILAFVLASSLPVAVIQDDEAKMRAFLAALIARDTDHLVENAHAEVRYDPDSRLERSPERMEKNVRSIFEKTRNCDVGAMIRGKGSLQYQVNWWCEYYAEPEGSPSQGAFAVLTVENGRIEISNFSWQGPYYPRPPLLRSE
ncbi:hypothetical protein [Qipengyuania nanhaisediminis]|uniref:hypothetical protein n=1 Tax=Qipengyuania nanhaisediminis TaxID=604088 RepID=UPI001160460C|nr:hypothetical protein [Qipengyuania nanhaisediminis]